MFRITHLLLVVTMVFATLLEQTDSFTVERVSVGDENDYIHPDSAEMSAAYGDRSVDYMDYEDSLEVENTKVNELVDEASEENRIVKRNSVHAPGQRGILLNQARRRFESMEDDDEMLFKHQGTQLHRRPTANSQRNHRQWDVSDEQQSWEVKDESLKKLFGIRWDSAKNKKFSHASSVEDSVEDLLHQQHQAHLVQIRSKRPSGTAF